MIEFGLLPSFVTTRQMSVLLRACHSKLIAPETSLALCIFAQPCGRPGCLAQILMNPNFRSNCGSLMILARNDSRPVAITWITVCIYVRFTKKSFGLQRLFDVKRGARGAAVSSPPPGNPEIAPAWFHADTISRVTGAASGTSHTHRGILFPDAEKRRAKCQRFQTRVPAIDESQGCSSKSHN